MMITRLIASAITLIGGHYLNRRWDRAILFMCIITIYWVIGFYLTFFLFDFSPFFHTEISPNLEKIISNSKIGFSLGIFIIWFISILLVISDYRNNIAPSIAMWTKSGITGAILTSLFTCLILALSTSMIIRMIVPTNEKYSSFPDSEYPRYTSNFFFEYLHFGGTPRNPFKLPPTPSGKGILKGRILFDDGPAEAVTLTMVLNSK